MSRLKEIYEKMFSPSLDGEKPSSIPKNYWIVLIVLFVMGFAIRWIFIHQCRFAGDEARFFGEAQGLWDDGTFPVLGTSVTGGEARLPGATFSLLMALPLLLVRSPLGCMALVVLLNLFAYWLLVSVVRRWLGCRSSIVFAVLILFSPWSYFYSDRIWNPNVLICFTAGLLWAFTRVIDQPRSRHCFWIPLVLMLVPQFHLSGILLLLLMALFWLVYRPQLNFWAVGWGVFVGCLFYVPYLIYECQHGFANTYALAHMPPDPEFSPIDFYRAPLNLMLFSSAEMGYLLQHGFWFPYSEIRFYFQNNGIQRSFDFFGGNFGSGILVGWTLYSVLLACTAWLIWFWKVGQAKLNAWKILRKDPLQLGFVMALVLAPMMLLVNRKGFHPHYIYLFFPFAFVPLVRFLSNLATGRWRHLVLFTLCAGAIVETAIAACAYKQSEQRFSFTEQREIMAYVYSKADQREFAIDFRLRDSRFSTHSYHVLAQRYFRKPFRENQRASLRFTIFDRDAGIRFLAQPQPMIRGKNVAESREFDATLVVVTQ